jgi:hypothetical protein
MYFNKNNINTIKDFLKLDTEICGFYFLNDKEPILFVDKIGEIEEKTGRHFCQHSKYSKIIWHTHPINGKAYPSVEDILKILKLRDLPKISLIFTSWGIWELHASKKGLIKDDLYKILEKELNKLYFNSEKGRAKMNEHLNENINKTINHIEKICKQYELKIEFTNWLIL